MNKIKGSIFGFAVGDALGCTTEFMTPKEIKEKYQFHTEITGGGIFHNWEKGETTDDTDMMMAVANGIIENPLTPIDGIGKNFIKWFDSKPKDIGVIVKQAIFLQKSLNDWNSASKKTHLSLNGKTADNGSLIRTLPVSLLYKNQKKVEEISILQSKMTHYDDLVSNACLIYNNIVFDILQEKSLKDSIREQISNTDYSSILHHKPFCESDSFVFNTLRWVLYILLNTNSYEESVQYAVNLGYDADTIAALVGGISGLYYGYEKIPQRYIDSLLLKNELDTLCKEIHIFRNIYQEVWYD